MASLHLVRGYRISPFSAIDHTRSHDISSSTEGRDFYVTPDAELVISRAVVLIKSSKSVQDLDEQEKKFYDQGTAEFCDFIL